MEKKSQVHVFDSTSPRVSRANAEVCVFAEGYVQCVQVLEWSEADERPTVWVLEAGSISTGRRVLLRRSSSGCQIGTWTFNRRSRMATQQRWRSHQALLSKQRPFHNQTRGCKKFVTPTTAECTFHDVEQRVIKSNNACWWVRTDEASHPNPRLTRRRVEDQRGRSTTNSFSIFFA